MDSLHCGLWFDFSTLDGYLRVIEAVSADVCTVHEALLAKFNLMRTHLTTYHIKQLYNHSQVGPTGDDFAQ